MTSKIKIKSDKLVRVGSVGLCGGNGSVEEGLSGRCAAEESGALGEVGAGFVAAGDGQVSYHFGGDSGFLRGSMDNSDLVVGIDDIEGAVGLKVIISGTGGGEVVALRHW